MNKLAANKLASIFKPYQTAWLVMCLFAALIITEAQVSNIDIALADYYFNPQKHSFAWRHTWFAQNFMHAELKIALESLALIIILLVVVDWLRPLKMLAKTRLRWQFVALAAIVTSTSIAALKHFSYMHCPWDIDRYGGSAHLLRLFDALPANYSAGQCFPAGHASTGLWLAAFCVFWLPNNPKKAVWVFIAGISVGLVLGWVQQMRGAHFLSHTLVSIWLASFVILIMLMLFREGLQVEKI
jgi:membrane-associated PAP2 superfamily phosphatase